MLNSWDPYGVKSNRNSPLPFTVCLRSTRAWESIKETPTHWCGVVSACTQTETGDQNVINMCHCSWDPFGDLKWNLWQHCLRDCDQSAVPSKRPKGSRSGTTNWQKKRWQRSWANKYSLVCNKHGLVCNKHGIKTSQDISGLTDFSGWETKWNKCYCEAAGEDINVKYGPAHQPLPAGAGGYPTEMNRSWAWGARCPEASWRPQAI